MSKRNIEIGNNIKKYRKGKMTQKELAEKINKTESSIRKYEKGITNIPLDVIEKIADVLNVSIDNLMNISNDELADEVRHLETFFSYLKELGFTVDVEVVDWHWDEIEGPDGKPMKIQVDDKHECIIKRDNLSAKFTEEEITEMQNLTKEIIEGKIYKKALEQQKRG